MHAIKVFIRYEFDYVSAWVIKSGIQQRNLPNWIDYDKLFRKCLADASDIFIDKSIPFGLQRLGEKVMRGFTSRPLFIPLIIKIFSYFTVSYKNFLFITF